MPVRIQEAQSADAEGISRVWARGWVYAYTGLLDQEYLTLRTSGKNLEDSLERSKRHLAGEHGEVFLVALDEDGQVAGFVRGGKSRSEELGTNVELYALYVDPDRHGLGIGRMLVQAFAKEAKSKYGSEEFAVGVLKPNKSVGFYENLGGKFFLETDWEYPKGKIPELFFKFQVSDILPHF